MSSTLAMLLVLVAVEPDGNQYGVQVWDSPTQEDVQVCKDEADRRTIWDSTFALGTTFTCVYAEELRK